MIERGVLYQSEKIWAQAMSRGQRNLVQAMIDFFPAEATSALDLGCGDGKLTERLAATVPQIVGLDRSWGALSCAGIPRVLGDATLLPFRDKSWDVVISTDMLEHLDDEAEALAWQECFRVADRWVMIAVPYQECLEEGMARCHVCGQRYHVNWHQRAYDWPALISRVPDTFEVDHIILTGESWSAHDPIEMHFRRTILEESAEWEEAICPHCHAKGCAAKRMAPLRGSNAIALGKQIYAALSQEKVHRDHSELLLIFRRRGVFFERLSRTFEKVMIEEGESNTYLFNKALLTDNLQPYPKIARAVKGVNHQTVLQFPVYAFKNCRDVDVEIAASTTVPFKITIRDGLGLVHSGICDPKATRYHIVLPRSLVAGYYGVLVYFPDNVPVRAVRVGEGLRWKQFSSVERTPAYLVRQINKREIIIQLDSTVAFFEPPIVVDVLMLCHDQHLDRRVLAQVNSLLERGYTVALIALSYTQEASEERLSSGLYLFRIGLSQIIPENSTYLAHQNRACYIEKWRIKSSTFFNYMSRLNRWIYKIQLYCRYRNLRMGDPLPFRQAFMMASMRIQSKLIQVHDLPALAAGRALSIQRGVPLVYDAHEWYPEQCTFSRVQRAICRQEEKTHIAHCDAVFTVNDSIAQAMQAHYAISPPITLWNALDPPKNFSLIKNHHRIHKALGIAHSKKIVLYQGGYIPHRNLENVIRAFRYVRHPEVVLVMLGFGEHEKRLQAIALDKRIHSRVYFLPAVSQEELLHYTASADVGIVPYSPVDWNSYYCTPNKLFEYIQAGVPIIANDLPELRRIVKQEEFGLVHSMKNAKSIARAIDAFFDSDQQAVWKNNVRKKRSQFSWTAQRERYLTVIEKLLGQ